MIDKLICNNNFFDYNLLGQILNLGIRGRLFYLQLSHPCVSDGARTKKKNINCVLGKLVKLKEN